MGWLGEVTRVDALAADAEFVVQGVLAYLGSGVFCCQELVYLTLEDL